MKHLEFSLADIVYIGLGGMLGSLLRWFLGIGYEGLFPVPTVLVNILGSVALGVLYASQHRLHPRGNYLYMVGFCGSFTTVSLFSHETIQLLEGGHWGQALVNLAVPVAVAAGLVAAIIKPVEQVAGRRNG